MANDPTLATDLATDDLYAALSPELRTLAMRGVARKYAKKAILINEGDEAGSLFVLLSGSVKAYAMDVTGREITYGVMSAGDYFGEMSLDGGLRSASVMALEPCSCALVSRRDALEHLSSAPGFALDLVVKVIQRARAATEAARSMALLDVYTRMAAVLQEGLNPEHYVELDDHAKGSLLVEPHVVVSTHLDLASRIGASREAISRILKQLEHTGHLVLSSKRITLLKRLPTQLL